MHTDSRINSIDLAKGILLPVILFLTDYQPGIIKAWFEGEMSVPGINVFTTLVISFFFFLAGIIIPFLLSKKIVARDSGYDIIKSIFGTSLILITTGVMMVNSTRIDAELTGFGTSLYSVILAAAVFLVWNRYPDRENNFFTVSGLRITGLALLVFLVFKFRSGSWENNGSIVTGYWELPGLYGWGFLITSLTWLLMRNSIAGTLIVWLFFLALCIFSALGLNSFLDPARTYLGVVLDGYIPFIFLSGLLTGIAVKRIPPEKFHRMLIIFIISGALLTAAGILSSRIVSADGTYGNPSWAMISSGFSILLFSLMLHFYDLKSNHARIRIAEAAGRSFFSAYTAAFLLYGIAGLAGLDPDFYRNSTSLAVKLAGSAVFSLTVTGIAILAARSGIRLKF